MLRLILRFLERRKQIYQARHNETSDASKTQPLQQWKVGREFRLRLKNALDEHQIQLGMPQQQIWHTCPTDELQHNQNSY